MTGQVFAPGSRGRLTLHDVERFAGTSLFERIARTVCRAECLPRKELYEAWEVARRVRRRFRGGRVVDVGAGHGLLAHIMLSLDDTSPIALVADPALPPSSARVYEALGDEWPRLAGRVSLLASSLEQITLEPGDVVVSCHACGALTDRVLEAAAAIRARVAVLPCCHAFQACSIDHSDISPFGINNLRSPNEQDSADCDKSSNVTRSLTGFFSIAAP